MKRDMDYIRELLLKIEESSTPLNRDDCMICDKSEEEALYHLWLLDGAGLIDVDFFYADNVVYSLSVKGLTWAGQDFLDSMRDSKIWRKAKTVISKTLGSTTLDLIKEVCHELSKKALMNGINLI